MQIYFIINSVASYIFLPCNSAQTILSLFYICKLSYFDVVCNIALKNLPEDGQNRCLKHVVSYAVYNKINLLSVYALVGHISHNIVDMFVLRSLTYFKTLYLQLLNVM